MTTIRLSATSDPREELFKVAGGFSEGVCVDADGNLRIAVWTAAESKAASPVAGYSQPSAETRPHTCSVSFAGPDLDVLVITTATEELSQVLT